MGRRRIQELCRHKGERFRCLFWISGLQPANSDFHFWKLVTCSLVAGTQWGSSDVSKGICVPLEMGLVHTFMNSGFQSTELAENWKSRLNLSCRIKEIPHVVVSSQRSFYRNMPQTLHFYRVYTFPPLFMQKMEIGFIWIMKAHTFEVCY